ncbi:unnamed protein product [Schistocephalus solidus]|uniref:CCT-eta n=1 Tax=Schistocephalus solidus TaxID=70667 RepID=A0A183SSC5_SCHSO|nr:unnamed protein product [Schistocephalus solidus]
MLPARIILLKEGTDTSQAVADAVRTTLGPRGMDKLMLDNNGKATISNDGATILKMLDIVHPAAKSLVDISRSQDAEVGDGTTSVTLLASEFLRQIKPFIEENVHPAVIIRAFREGSRIALSKLNELACRIQENSPAAAENVRNVCCHCSKLENGRRAQRFLFEVGGGRREESRPVPPTENDRHKKGLLVAGGALEDSMLVNGVAFKKTFSYAGFEMQPKSYKKPLIALLNIELELKAEKENAEVRLNTVEEYQKVVDAEWSVLYEKLNMLHKAGVKIVLSKLPIGDVATQYFADRDMFCAGRVPEEDLKRTQMACGGSIQTTVHGLTQDMLGQCDDFQEIQIGSERFNIFRGGLKAQTCTIILRGGAEQFMEETERSLHDAIMIVRRAIKNDAFVAGGGAIDIELSKHLREYARSIPGKDQLFITAMARAFEVIPRQLCDVWAGVDIQNEDIANNFEKFVWEPALVKGNAIIAATEAACLILSVDETIKNPESKNPTDEEPVGRRMPQQCM